MGAFVLSSEERRLKEKVTICSSLQHAGDHSCEGPQGRHSETTRPTMRCVRRALG